MDVRTGNWTEAADFRDAMEKLQEQDPETQAKDVVMLDGHREAVEELSRQVKAARDFARQLNASPTDNPPESDE